MKKFAWGSSNEAGAGEVTGGSVFVMAAYDCPAGMKLAGWSMLIGCAVGKFCGVCQQAQDGTSAFDGATSQRQ